MTEPNLNAPPHPRSGRGEPHEELNPLQVNDVRKVMFSLHSIKTLRRHSSVSRSFLADANTAISARTAYVTEDDVAQGLHVLKLRRLVETAEPGQTIQLAAGRYVLGDETVEGHCRERIRYPGRDPSGSAVAVDEDDDWPIDFDFDQRYGGDVQWNDWKDGYGSLQIKKAGLRIIGPRNGERATLVFKAHYWYSADPVAVHVLAHGVRIEDVNVEGYCTALSVGDANEDELYKEQFYDEPSHLWGEDFKGVRASSALIKRCNFRGTSLRICAECTAEITDCTVEDDNGGFDLKASVYAGVESKVHLTRTKIVNSGRRSYQTLFERNGDGIGYSSSCLPYGGMYLDDRSTTHLTDVEMRGNVPGGLVIATRQTNVVLCGTVSFSNNTKGIKVTLGPPYYDTTRTFACYPRMFSRKKSFFDLYQKPDKNAKVQQPLAEKNIESAGMIFSSDGSSEGDNCLKQILSKIKRVEEARGAIATSFDFKTSKVHEEGTCPADCEICQYDIHLPSYPGDRHQEVLDHRNAKVSASKRLKS